MHKVIYYRTQNNKCPFDEWVSSLDNSIQIRIIKRINRIYDNNFGDYKKIDNDLYEMRFSYGAGYRIYYSIINNIIVILISGGDKSSQPKDIQKAKEYLQDIKERYNG